VSVGDLQNAFRAHGGRTAIVWNDRPVSYDALAREVDRWIEALASKHGINSGHIVALSADYSPQSLALLLALLDRGAIVVPLTRAFADQKKELFAIAEVQTEIEVDDRDQVTFANVGHESRHPLLIDLKRKTTGGLILFSSGSSGRAKAVVHDGARLLAKYKTPRRAAITIPFMLFDHIGGINTVMHILSSGGTAVIAVDRSPQAICRSIERHRVQVLPTTPTFVNLLLLSDHEAYDMSSLEILSYGAERMSASTLARLAAAFPRLELVQNYGLSEVGILRSESESSGSLWVRLGGDGFETRVVDGLLEIKAATAMVGYLNEASPFTEDGWLRTGDRVESKGDYLRILGRQSDIIIIGGEKVYPAEIEDLLCAMPGVLDATVSGEANAITGQIAKAEVRLSTDESRADFAKRMAAHLRDRVPGFKIPQRVVVTKDPLHNARFKKTRGSAR
jgi:acyl-CoA synthetase (AMP-forming)/AMP-acid ligase II